MNNRQRNKRGYRKETNTYYFSVEGETEEYYFQWLQTQINECPDSKYKVKIYCKKQKDPFSYAKSLTILDDTEITHVFDRESEVDEHKKQFISTLDRMIKAQEERPNIRYNLGYSNFTFELWLILHKIECNDKKTNRTQYLKALNKVFNEKFSNLKLLKNETNFKRILGKMVLADVIDAISRAKKIMDHNAIDYRAENYKGYHYYTQNPSLSIWESIELMLKECGVID